MEYHEVFKALKATNSRNDKIAILKQAGVLTQEMLKYAYDPFKHYYINKIPKGTEHEPDADLVTWNWTILLDKLQNRILSGDEAKLHVANYMSRLSKKDQEIFSCILKKDLRCGISAKTINVAFPGLIPEFDVMLAKKWDDSRYCDDLFMSIKYDGVRAVFKEGSFYTRNGHKLIGLSHLTSIIPVDYSFDGELIIPGLHFQEASGYIRSDDPTPSAVYMVFDVPASTMPFDRRYQLYSDVCGVLDTKYIQPVKHIKVKNLEHIYQTFDKVINAGYEGLVIKPAKHKYQMKRSWDWMKLKVENTEDLKIIGFFEGEGKYVGQLGGLIVDYHGVAVRVGSGFSDTERVNIWQDQESFINQLIEVKYHEVTPDGSLRHPVYKGFRWDK